MADDNEEKMVLKSVEITKQDNQFLEDSGYRFSKIVRTAIDILKDEKVSLKDKLVAGLKK